MTKSNNTYKTKGYAVVTKKGKVIINTICPDRESVEFIFNADQAKDAGSRIKPITVTCEWR